MRDRHPSGICQMVMATIHGSVATDLHVLSSRRRHEKNWMPLVREVRRFGSHDPRWVYSCSPFLIVNHRGTVHQGSLASPYIARHFRGGSQVIPVDDGLRGLALVHESVNFDSPPRRVYQHRFILIDHTTGKLVRISPPFCFEGRGLEFAAGLAMMGDDLVISYGIDDARAYLMKVPLDRVFGLLRDPLPEEG